MSDPSKVYNRVKYICFFVGLFLDVLVISLFYLSRASFGLRDFCTNFFSNIFLIQTMYFSLIYVGLSLIHLPLDIFVGFIWEHKYQFSTQNFRQWLIDDLKRFGLGLIIFLITMNGLYIILSQFSDKWWVLAGLFWLFLTIFLARITPQFIIPLFLKYKAVEDQNLRQSIFSLFQECRVPLRDIHLVNLSSKTKKPNAFMCGLGKSRRVILSDTLVDNFSLPEIETVVAHELGHYKHHDILVLTVLNALVVLGGLWGIDRFWKTVLQVPLADMAYFPLLALLFGLFGFVTMPFLNAVSRYCEIQADRFSLRVTQKPTDFISMIQKLGEMTLAEFEPGWLKETFFYDHPPIIKRIKFAESFTS